MEKTYGGHTVAALREFLQHGDDTGETIDELTGDESSSANIIRDLLAAIHSDAAQAPIYQTCFIQGQWRDVDRAEYDRAKSLRDDLARIVYAAPVAPAAPTPTVAADAAEQAPWISVADRMPASGRTVLATYLNSAGKSRRIRAQYIAAKTRESNGEDGDLEFEYDEGADTYYWPAGWYECVDNWSDLTHLMVSEGDITHWVDMPPAPGEPNAAPITALATTQGAAQ